MAKKYTPEFRAEAVKLSQEIGARPASERLNINLDTMYTWISKAKHRQSEVDVILSIIVDRFPSRIQRPYATSCKDW